MADRSKGGIASTNASKAKYETCGTGLWKRRDPNAAATHLKRAAALAHKKLRDRTVKRARGGTLEVQVTETSPSCRQERLLGSLITIQQMMWDLFPIRRPIVLKVDVGPGLFPFPAQYPAPGFAISARQPHEQAPPPPTPLKARGLEGTLRRLPPVRPITDFSGVWKRNRPLPPPSSLPTPSLSSSAAARPFKGKARQVSPLRATHPRVLVLDSDDDDDDDDDDIEFLGLVRAPPSSSPHTAVASSSRHKLPAPSAVACSSRSPLPSSAAASSLRPGAVVAPPLPLPSSAIAAHDATDAITYDRIISAATAWVMAEIEARKEDIEGKTVLTRVPQADLRALFDECVRDDVKAFVTRLAAGEVPTLAQARALPNAATRRTPGVHLGLFGRPTQQDVNSFYVGKGAGKRGGIASRVADHLDANARARQDKSRHYSNEGQNGVNPCCYAAILDFGPDWRNLRQVVAATGRRFDPRGAVNALASFAEAVFVAALGAYQRRALAKTMPWLGWASDDRPRGLNGTDAVSSFSIADSVKGGRKGGPAATAATKAKRGTCGTGLWRLTDPDAAVAAQKRASNAGKASQESRILRQARDGTLEVMVSGTGKGARQVRLLTHLVTVQRSLRDLFPIGRPVLLHLEVHPGLSPFPPQFDAPGWTIWAKQPHKQYWTRLELPKPSVASRRIEDRLRKCGELS